MNALRAYRDLDIDWSMTPWDAVTLYLEWGNNCWNGDSGVRQPVRSKDDYSNYFVIYTWDPVPKVMLIRRNSEQAQELASLDLPEGLRERFLDEVGHLRGVFPPNAEVKEWLRAQMNN